MNPGFSLDEDAEVEAVTEICRRLDGIALGDRTWQSARMVSMTPVRCARSVERPVSSVVGVAARSGTTPDTLRQAVQWSYDLLTPRRTDGVGERVRCSQAASTLTAVTAVCDRFDEYAMLGSVGFVGP